MFSWLRARRRRKILSRPFPSSWEAIIKRNAVYTRGMENRWLAQVKDTIKILVSEKHWEGCGGLKIEDEHRVTIAAQIAKMTLGMPDEYFAETKSVLLYPHAYVAKSQQQIGSGFVVEGPSGRAGEAWYRGPVILSWDDVLATGRQQNFARNVVIHEFAHQLDMRNGAQADGVPTIESAEFADRWVRVMKENYERLRNQCQNGVRSLLDCYGATNHAEFFAVASEVFFEEPEDLEIEWPELFEILCEYYRLG